MKCTGTNSVAYKTRGCDATRKLEGGLNINNSLSFQGNFSSPFSNYSANTKIPSLVRKRSHRSLNKCIRAYKKCYL